jgi:chromosome segregation protein
VYLKKLDIFGFKSFANKTTIALSHGLTAIVGPNGCGKTNVLDALRWVLGEQKPTLLRGGKMEEVIFNGTREAKPLGIAEVTLTVVNDRGILATEYNELQITRRLFRSGESEYLLNKVPCRLKDITDLFVDTGMGAHSYSVIQQDMIESVISDRAEERRFLFEEAAGITKYKQRRKAAVRKLEATEQDFLRLRDIYSEVKTRVNSLYRQHKKAERYQKVLDEIRGWELYTGANRTEVLDRERRELRGRLDELSRQKIEQDTGLETRSAELELSRGELLDLERELSTIARDMHEISERAHASEREISILGEKKSNARQLIERNEAEIKQLDSRLSSLAEQLLAAQSEIDTHQRALQEVSSELSEAEGTQAEADQQLLLARMAREDKSKKLLELEGRLSSGLTEENSLRQQEEEFVLHLTEIERQIGENEPRQKELLGRIQALQLQLDTLMATKTGAEQRRTALANEIEQLSDQIEEATEELSNLTASVEAAEARRNLLEEMMLHYEGYDAGAIAAMEERERWPGVAGTVADKLVPVEGMELAVEAALGEMARFLICHDRATAEQIIAYLRREKKGRTGILVPDTGTITAVVKRPDISESSDVVGWLDSFVSTDDDLKQLKDAILARTVVFREGADPAPLLEILPLGFTAVSTDGLVYRKNIIAGGSDDDVPLFRRKEKVREQTEMLAELQAQSETVKRQKNQLGARLAAARADLSQTNGQLEVVLEELDEVQKEKSETDFEHRSLVSEFERLSRERKMLKTRIEAVQNRQTSLGLDSSQLAIQKDSLVNTMTEAGEQLEDLERRASEAVERVSRAQVKEIEARSKVEQTESRVRHLGEVRTDIERTLGIKRSEIETARRDIVQSDERTTQLEGELRAAFNERDDKQAQVETRHELQTNLQQRVAEIEKSINEARARRDSINEEIHRLDMRINTIDSEVRAISDRLREEYEVDIHTVTAVRPDPDMPEEGITEHLATLKEKLKKFGAVNLLALEEYKEASEREKFLGEQLTDLEKAKNDLNATITKINQTARQLFNETLEKVQENFQSLFVELFNGGEANIRLIDEDDPLESDIDIIARPRGKKLLSITMMSGGERALTAIALLFSLYLVKPSPFCILDEIDAPLDDANCHRFLRIIRKFSVNTQFVTITHNKITMEAADNLYGITMEQAGISKLVAVRFRSEDGSTEVETEVDQDIPESIRERITPDVPVTHPEEN